jgi:AraC-like DNA-binding protein
VLRRDHSRYGVDYAVSELECACSEIRRSLELQVTSSLQITMVDDAPRSFHFDTNELPERDRFPAFCEEMFRNVVGADIARLGSAPFHGMISLRKAGRVKIINLAATSSDIVRDARRARDGDDDIVVQLWQQGVAEAFQGSQQNQVAPHEAVVLDNAEAARVCFLEASRFLVLAIPREKIIGLEPRVDRVAGSKLRNGLSLRLLQGYLQGTLEQDIDDHPAAELLGNHLVDLIALAVGGEDHDGRLEQLGGVRAARLAAIRRMISQQFGNPGLNAATIAAQLGITPRYLHMLLEETGGSFNQHLLEKRLEQAAALLRDPRRQGRKISDIAQEAGFNDLSYFNRAFRRRFGDTPSGVRYTAYRSSNES